MPYIMFSWSRACRSGEKDFDMLSMYFHCFALRLGKVESPLLEDDLLKLVEISNWVLEKISRLPQCILTISQLSPLEKGGGPSIEQTWIPFTQGCFVPS